MANSTKAEIVLVTGGSSGIGKACCDLLSHHRIVYGASRTQPIPGGWSYLKMDVTEEASVEQAVASILAQHGRIDAVVLCAGYSLSGSVEETSDEEALHQFGTNYFGTIRVIRAVLPILRAQSSGKLVIIGSIGGLISLPFQAHYSATKFALDGMAEALRHELLPFGIFVSIVHPGNFKTAVSENRLFASQVGPSSPYGSAQALMLKFYAEEEIDGRSPELIALTVEQILNTNRPRLRYLNGSWLERLGVLGKRMLPNAVFDFLFRRLYLP